MFSPTQHMRYYVPGFPDPEVFCLSFQAVYRPIHGSQLVFHSGQCPIRDVLDIIIQSTRPCEGQAKKYLKHLAGVEPTTSWFPVTILYHWATRAFCYIFYQHNTWGITCLVSKIPWCFACLSKLSTALFTEANWSFPVVNAYKGCDGYNNTKHKALRGTGEKYLKHLAGVEPTTSWFPVTILYHWATRASYYVFTNTTHEVLRVWFPRSRGVLLVFPSCLPPYSRKPTGLSQWSMPYKGCDGYNNTKHNALRGTGEKYLKHLAGVEPTTSWFPVTMLYHLVKLFLTNNFKILLAAE